MKCGRVQYEPCAGDGVRSAAHKCTSEKAVELEQDHAAGACYGCGGRVHRCGWVFKYGVDVGDGVIGVGLEKNGGMFEGCWSGAGFGGDVGVHGDACGRA